MNNLVRSSALVISTLAAGIAQAHDNQTCNMHFDGNLRITPDAVVIKQSGKTLTIEGDSLFIDGSEQTLNAAQRRTMTQYAEHVRGTVPQVASIALEGVKLANVAVSEVMQGFGIDFNTAPIQTLLSDVETEIQQSFYQDGSFVIDQENLDLMGENIGKRFEGQMDEVMEKAMMESMGSLLMTIGREMMFSGGDMTAFEQRMEKMGEQIEERVEGQAKLLEQRADQFCHSLEDVAKYEQQFHDAVPQASDYALFEDGVTVSLN